MNARERFLSCMQFAECDRPPRWEWGFRADTTERWRDEGLPPSVPDEVSWTDYFGLDRGGGYANGSMAEKVGVNVHLLPGFAGEVLAEDERTLTCRNNWGAVITQSKVGVSIPQYLSFGLKTREDFREYRKRWDPHDPARYPEDWEARKARWRDRDCPLSMWTFGWYGVLRELMGVEGLSIAFFEDPALIEEICEFWSDFVLQVFERALIEAKPDYALFWEDLAFKTGPLLSPRLFRRFILPQYKRVIEGFRKHGMRVFMVDSDGNIDDILPLWLEAGVNVLAPFEVAAGMDVVEVRRTYGKDLAIVGGIDKMEIARGREAIEAETLRRVPPLLEDGGYIPTLDHGTLPGISFDDYVYYREFLTQLCEG